MVFAAPALVVAVLLVGPAVGDDEDPEPSYMASFDACQGVPRSGFSDVSRSHPNAGDIDCVVYYGIFKGTSPTAFSPSSTVTRQQMALFLARLAAVVGIERDASSDWPGFADTADLPDGARNAVALLVDLGVIQGSPEDRFQSSRLVTRGEAALFVARLMDLMTPMNDPSMEVAYGYRPSEVGIDVEATPDVDESEEVGVPFTDLGPALKIHYDAIVQLYELGVVSGTSVNTYGPQQAITRASMAGVMARLLDHSNARPAGLTLQATPLSGWGDTDVTLVASMRDRRRSALADQAIDVFGSTDHHGGLSDTGECDQDVLHSGDCQWNQEDAVTDSNGNLFLVDFVPGGDAATFYAWIGNQEGQIFDLKEVSYATVSIPTRKGHTSLQVTGINQRAATVDSGADADSDDDEPQVHLGTTRRVTFKLQLLDDTRERVPRPGVEITVSVRRTIAVYTDGGEKSYAMVLPHPDDVTLTTGQSGSTSFTVERPEDDDEDDRQEALDTITFTSGELEEIRKIRWIEEDRVTYSADGVAPRYVLLSRDDQARVSATVTLYDQYGRRLREASDQRVTIDFEGGGEADTGTVRVRSSGAGRRAVTLRDQSAGTDITVSYDPVDVDTDSVDLDEVVTNPPDDTVSVVLAAKRHDTGPKEIHTFEPNRNLFTTEVGAPDGVADGADRLYRYDANDFFVGHDHIFDMREFEELLANPTDEQGNPADNQAVVDIVLYNPGGLSVFVVTTDSAGN